MSNITKGKWKATPIYGDHWTVSVDGRTVIDCFSNQANARLIAAAPEMYELLKSVAAYHSGIVWDVVCKARELLDRIDGKEEKA